MAILYIIFGFVLLITTFNVWTGNYSTDEVRAHWITVTATFVVATSAMVASVRFGKHTHRANPKFYASIGVLGSTVGPGLMPFILDWLGIEQSTSMVYGGGWLAGMAVALMVAMPIVERIERSRRAPVYWEPPNNDRLGA